MKINRTFLMRCWLLILAAILPGGAHAANYTFYWEGLWPLWGGYTTNAPCTGNWSYSSNSNTFTCTGSLNLKSGDTLQVNAVFLGNIAVIANGGFVLSSNTIGTSSKNITLSAGYSPVTATGTNTVHGSVLSASGSITLAGTAVNGSVESASGAIALTNSSIIGTLTSSGNTRLTGSSVSGATRITNDLTATNSTFTGNVTVSGTSSFTGGSLAASLFGGGSVTTTSGTTIGGSLSNDYGAVSLDGGLVGGNVSAAADVVTSTGAIITGALSAGGTVSLNAGSVGSINAAQNVTTINGTVITGALTASGEVTLGAGSVGGKVSARKVVADDTNFSGDIVATEGLVTLTGGSVTGNISSNCCTVTLNKMQITGNVTARQNNIMLDGSTVTGNLVTTNEVRLLNDSFVYGDVTAATWGNTTITGTGRSHVYGVCTPTGTTPADLCDGEIKPVCLTSSPDNFNRSILGGDWAVTSRSGTFGNPRIVNGRLRLTDDSTNVATGATVQRTFPAANNLISVTFKYYGYSTRSNRGADGMALIVSDARVTPQPGAYGGSLGYAQKTGISGFAGGWLGIGFDEFGNYSNATEGRSGGIGSRSDAIAIRGSGSGTDGYRYLTGTGTLSNGIDNPSSTSLAGPGHLYRVTIDSRTRGKTLVTVERDTGGSGRNYSTLVSAYDVQAHSTQDSVPDNFWLSFTGSTGSNVNIHELDDLQVCANRMNPIGTQIDHFEIIAPSSGLTCSPLPVTVKACLDSACALYTEAVTATAVLSANGSIVSSDTRTFIGGSGGFSLSRTTKGSATLGIASSNPATKPLSQTLCKIGSGPLGTNCTLTFADSGFVFDVPTQLSNKLSDDVLIRAVRKDDTSQRCVPAFQNVERDVQFWSGYIDPSASAGRSLEVNGTAVSSAEASPTTLKLAFDNDAQAPIKVRYNDAGKLELNARYSGSSGTGDSGLSMLGSDQFVVKPIGLCVEPTDSPAKWYCEKGDASCQVFVSAGDGFPVRFKPVGWQGDEDEDLCLGNPTTPNFRHDGIALASVLVAPTDGVEGTVTLAANDQNRYDHKPTAGGTVQDVKLSEVGVFRISATPPAGGYLDGETVAGGTSVNIGRITPAYLEATGAGSLRPACSAGYTYQAQPLELSELPSLTITGKNRSGVTTTNYDRGAFWKFPGAWSPRFFSSVGRASLDQRIPVDGAPTDLDCTLENNKASCVAARLGVKDLESHSETDTTVGDGARTMSASLILQYLRGATPDSDDRLFDAQIEVFTDKAQLIDSDGVETQEHHEFSMGGSQVLLGRYRQEGATGSELSPLRLPLVLEKWTGSAFVMNTDPTDDDCAAVSDVIMLDPSGNLSVGDTTATLGEASQGIRQITLSAPGAGNAGSIRVEPQVPSWLHFDWLGTGPSNPSAIAIFGGYAGSKPLIFRREIYRGM
ncbi:DUF6701 domain-containing protein [Stutzerimonas nitrititolerans]|uniref:DUF6701 domain-containing protein n=2 Tax=Stutzerimonas nitrititolerans TaxID=2482751 RepID=UPI001EE6788D|nr:DUF6701 domain-containing protein [Stutzerimonas nitrititolerans]